MEDQFISDNPGKVVTKFQFSALFHNTWLKSMTVANITAGFRVTGVYHSDAVCVLYQESEVLSKESGLSFIPLYSPSPRLQSSYYIERQEEFSVES